MEHYDPFIAQRAAAVTYVPLVALSTWWFADEFPSRVWLLHIVAGWLALCCVFCCGLIVVGIVLHVVGARGLGMWMMGYGAALFSPSTIVFAAMQCWSWITSKVDDKKR